MHEPGMDGLLVIDKPAGPTSHDVVARIRRVIGEQRVGHTGTLAPAATGVLPLVVGRATRLARFLSASDKTYEAEIRLGAATDTYDATGAAVASCHTGAWPSRDDVMRALDAFRGEFLQQPPAFSAKKVAGRRSYSIARAVAGSVAGSETGRSEVEVSSESGRSQLGVRSESTQSRLGVSSESTATPTGTPGSRAGHGSCDRRRCHRRRSRLAADRMLGRLLRSLAGA